MRESMRHVYREIYDIYQGAFSPRHKRNRRVDGMRLVREALDNIIIDMNLSERIRPDGKLFLFINIHQMVVFPLLKENEISNPSDREETLTYINDIIKQDIRAVLELASQQSSESEIDAHDILAAAYNLYDDSRISSYAAW